MRITIVFLLGVGLLVSWSCGGSQTGDVSTQNEQTSAIMLESARGGGGGGTGFAVDVSLAQLTAVHASTVAAEHKIIRNAEITIETDSPSDGMNRVAAIAESHGGFVVTSEFKHDRGSGEAQPRQVVTVIIRVPASQFAVALDDIRKVGSQVIQQKVAGQDVTEEYLDVEARLRTKKALEAQFLEIMKQANKVSEALEVQSELAGVRSEIEQLEGRRQFLENQSALSTINVTLEMPLPLLAANSSNFIGSIRQAMGEGVDITASILLGFIRLIIVLIPVVLLIIVPVWFMVRLILRRINVAKLLSKATPSTEEPA